ncbi:ABC transporter substrate-binding protein [Candidatus Magnetomonas plexicatena]|uniref:ABC transporter substrate-binding protein n=1 Tax=Candidatus Magnetomonas plexicatena TaxID=2552947 RepID=UPI001C759418|nr:ABC transporter substrate-binding protein [Nitrospirales bacterium LBB_01]
MRKYKRYVLISTAIMILAIIAVRNLHADKHTVLQSQTKDLSKHPIYSKYKLEVSDNIINVGVQPLYSPTGIIAELLKRDKILQLSLAKLGMKLRFYSFLKGSDINYFMKNGSLNAGIGGDMPTIRLASTFDIVIPSIIQMGYTAIIAKQPVLIKELKGKRIGYAYGSNAHYGLMSALALEGVSERDVTFVPMDLLEMPKALENSDVFAFSAWDPVTTIATQKSDEAFAVHKMMTTGFLYFHKSLYQRQPKAIHYILAAESRAIKWLMQSKENRIKAASWVIQSVNGLYTDKQSNLTVELLDELTLKQLLNITALPNIPDNIVMEQGPLYNEFIFLKKIGLLPPDAIWGKVHDSFTNAALLEVHRNPELYRLSEFEYEFQENNK